MNFEHIKDNRYKLIDSLDEKVDEITTFSNSFIGNKHKVLNTNNIILDIQQRLLIATYVVNNFITVNEKLIVNNEAFLVTVNILGKIYTINLGLFHNTLIFNIEE